MESYEKLRAQRERIEAKTKKLLTAEDVRLGVDRMLATRTQMELAAELGVSASYLNDYLKFRRDPGPALLDGLGIEKVVLYRRLAPNAAVGRRPDNGGKET